jgi:glutathione S-transferase
MSYSKFSAMLKTQLQLIIGDKNLSSWSMRPWLVLKASELPFKETKILLDRPTSQKQIKKYSPSGRVPALIHGTTTIWDSLSICEYVHELAPDKELWPRDSKKRAVARSCVAEMHAGFASLREQLSMDISLKIRIKHLAPNTIKDIERVIEIWDKNLSKSKGPFLFGSFGIVDAFYAPVVFRFLTYGLQMKNVRVQKYMKTIVQQKYVQDWAMAAKKEKPHFIQF